MEAKVGESESLAPPAHGQADAYPHLALARQVFDLGLDAQFRTDGHGIVLDATHAAAKLMGCSREFLVGKPLGLFVTEGHRGRFYKALWQFWQGVASDVFESQVGRRGNGPRDVVVVGCAEPRSGDEDRRAVQFHWQFFDVTNQKQVEAARDDLLRRIVTAQEDERRRVSRELHDSVGQLLTALTLAVKAARKADPAAVDDRLDLVQQLANELARTVHDLAVRLRPAALDDLGLRSALGQFLAGWSERNGVEVDFVSTIPEEERLPPEVETTIYRLVQEAMTNVARHARAHRVSVVLGRGGGFTTVAIEDDGVGFDPEAVGPGRLGIIGMRERAALTGGAVDVESAPGRGTTILARFPLTKRGKP